MYELIPYIEPKKIFMYELISYIEQKKVFMYELISYIEPKKVFMNLSGALWMIHFLQTKLAHHQVQQRVATEVLERWISFCWVTVNSFQSLQSSNFFNCGFNAFCWGGRGRHRPNTSTQKEPERDRAELERRGHWTAKGKLTKTPTCGRSRN